jgi:hypothetical protein
MKKTDNDLKISRLCQLLNVPIASHYYRPVDKPETAQYFEVLTVIHKKNFQAYGRRRMKVALHCQGTQLDFFKTSRLMKEGGIIKNIGFED